MSLSTYQLVLAIAEYGNMTRAAESLHITPSAASHAISALEDSFGFPMFYRGRSGATLTPLGQSLLPRIRTILSEEAHLQEEISKIHGLYDGTVHIGVFNTVCTHWLPSILRSFQTKYPNIQVRIFQDSYTAIEEKLLESALDFSFLSLPTSDKFSTITLAHDRLVCITPSDYTPSNGSYVSNEELHSMNLILCERGYDRTIQQFLSEHNLKTSPLHYITLESSIIALIEGGMACSIMPELVLRKLPGDYKVYPLQDNIYRTIALGFLKGQTLSPACEKMIEEIRSYVDQHLTFL